jgi:lipopolysaccharide export system permease protein
MNQSDAAAAPLGQLYHPGAALTQAQKSKWLVEAQRRLTSPVTAIGFTLIGLLATLGGAFRRHGGVLRPFLAVVTVTLLVALNLGVINFATKHLTLSPLIWLTVVLPGLISGALLFFPRSLTWLRGQRRSVTSSAL